MACLACPVNPASQVELVSTEFLVPPVTSAQEVTTVAIVQMACQEPWVTREALVPMGTKVRQARMAILAIVVRTEFQDNRAWKVLLVCQDPQASPESQDTKA